MEGCIRNLQLADVCISHLTPIEELGLNRNIGLVSASLSPVRQSMTTVVALKIIAVQ